MTLTDEQWLEYLLRHATNEVLHVAAFQGGSIQSQGKWVLSEPANKLRKLAEAAAVAPLLERIAVLEAQVEQAAQPVAQEPIGYMNAGHVYELQQRRIHYGYVYPKEGTGAEIPVYTSPPKAAALTDEQIDKAAKVLSHCMDYPWEWMPEAGRETMRKNARTVIEAAIGTPATVEKEVE